MRVYLFYGTVFFFITGLVTLITSTNETGIFISILLMIGSLAMATVLSCFELKPDSQNPVTQTLVSLEIV